MRTKSSGKCFGCRHAFPGSLCISQESFEAGVAGFSHCVMQIRVIRVCAVIIRCMVSTISMIVDVTNVSLLYRQMTVIIYHDDHAVIQSRHATKHGRQTYGSEDETAEEHGLAMMIEPPSEAVKKLDA
jgi:hypothetical protein